MLITLLLLLRTRYFYRKKLDQAVCFMLFLCAIPIRGLPRVACRGKAITPNKQHFIFIMPKEYGIVSQRYHIKQSATGL
ncbi:hypothetical protein MADE_000001023695 [Alteromonas mediterranea DE]|uniref:Uncharacterized protein n=1 Tax=Alteromonas mediterranea (strain DSM 17117 / CIP 110805 / LMG 28347 / Deep ecotype) TaxID=1774373 RepID=T2DMI2_ALTMD|nr:hypothetical protein MADE_000001023695 [Alteromonas mediterranea DE]